MRIFFAWALLAWGIGCTSPLLLQANRPVRPNVLFIAVDDMNDWVGPLGGYPGVITPNLDRLAGRGITFTHAHTAAAACHPSRVAVMTGVRPSTTGITRNVFNKKAGPSWRKHPKLADVPTLSQHFRNHGYRAVGGGKIYHSLQWWSGSENDPSTWDAYFPEAHKPIPHQIRPPKHLIHSDALFGRRPLGNGGLFGWAPIAESDEKMSDYQVASWAIEELGRRHDKPFFVAAGIFRPHIPWEVPQKYFDLYPLDEIRDLPHREDDLIDAWDHGRRHWHQWVLQNRQWKKAIQGYLASISFADAQIGRMLDALERSAHRDNTIVVLWSDHGMHIGEKENWEKFTVWERATRIPMFVVAPGVTRPGSRCDRPVSSLDLYPTLAELAGLPLPEHLEGESLVPLLRDPQNGRRVQPAITQFAQQHGVRTRHWRYCRNPNGLEELYDHRNDPNEFVNRAYQSRHAGVLAEHRALLERYCGVKPPEPHALPDDYVLDEAQRPRRKNFVLMRDRVEQARREHRHSPKR